MHRKTKRLKVDFSMDIEVHHITDIFEGERYVGNLARTIAQGKASLLNDLKNSDGVATSHCLTRPVYKLLSIALDERSYAEKEDWNKVLEVAAKAARIRAIQLHLSIYSNLKFQLPYTTSSSDKTQAKRVSTAFVALEQGEHGRCWIYDTGCSKTSVGFNHLTPSERKRIFTVDPYVCVTAAGTTTTTKAVWCNVPYLGKRRCYVMSDCPPLLSVNDEVEDHGAVFLWDRKDGARATLADGTTVYLPTSRTNVPELDGYVTADANQWTETPELDGAANLSLQCQPCEQPLLPPPGLNVEAAMARKATHNNCLQCVSQSKYVQRRQQEKLSQSTLSLVAAKRRQWCPERKLDGVTPNLVLKEDEPTIGTRHGSVARSTSANPKHQAETRANSRNWLSPSGPFIVEVFSGSGRLASAARELGVTAYEYDLNQQGGYKNLLKKNVLKELTDLIMDPFCMGIWFGFPCGTFSSARRNDGGPPPLRGINSKDIWGLPHLEGKEKARVQSANKLLLRMHELMRLCERQKVPFYLENPQRSKLWMHPLIKKWIRHNDTQLVNFDYCQFGTSWKKSTTVLAYGNKKFNNGIKMQCRETWRGKQSICSRTGEAHELLAGFIKGRSKGQYKTNKACPYPYKFCEHVAPIIVSPQRLDHGENQAVNLAAISMEKPPDDHYLTHLPKHPGCTACNNCKVQRKHCRDKVKAKKRKHEQTIKLHVTPKEGTETSLDTTPKKFGDTVTSDSIFVIRKNLGTSRTGDTTALVIRDRGTKWTMSYPAKSKSSDEVKEAVQDFKGAENVQLWYSDGAPELHVACREVGIRHDTSDPHRSETNGVIERTNRTVIEGTRTLIFQSGLPTKYWKLATKCFCCLYNFSYTDPKRGTTPYFERHGHKFSGKLIPFGALIRYLPSAEKELGKRDKFDASLRNGIFVGYRMHTGGRWTSQYVIIDTEAFAEINADTNRCAYAHAVSEIYIPGSCGDDRETFPTFPVANGVFKEARASTTDGSSESTVVYVETLQSHVDEFKISSERPEEFLLTDDMTHPGGANGESSGNTESSVAPAVPDKDSWSIQGDYLVRTHVKPRTTLFSPIEDPHDPPPIDQKYIEVLRTTKPRFAGQQWPSMELIEDCWMGQPSDAKPLRNPADGSTLSWTGETIFERVLPKPPKGKMWCGSELVRARAGSRRAPDVHPLHWWLMSTTARLKATDQWKTKYKEISQAQNRRTIPREVLDAMPKPSVIKEYHPNPAGASTMVLLHDHAETHVLHHADDDPLPDLVAESESEFGDNLDDDDATSVCSSVDSACGFYEQRFNEDRESNEGMEDSIPKCTIAAGSDNYDCQICSKPMWNNSFNPQRHHCRDFCMHRAADSPATVDHTTAPSMTRDLEVLNYAMLLMPDETQKPNQQFNGIYDGETLTNDDQHRAKELPKGDQLNPLIAWYSLVAKPVPRKEWQHNATATVSIDAQWAKLRAADDGKGTWDESVVRNYWDIQREAKQKLETTGVHTHFGTLFDLCVVKHSELDESKHKYKGRVVFGGHRIHDEYGLAAEFPEQGSGASMLAASKLCDAVALLPGCAGQQSDAPSAYTQSKLGTGMRNAYIVTWVELPKEQWPKAWHTSGMTRPCCQLRLSLYGHPMSGKYWENHFTERLKSVGFESISGWECLFVHKKLKLILSVYVDDFKLVGKAENLETGWKIIKQSGLVMDPPDPLGDYLGCGQFPIEVSPAEAQERLKFALPLLEGTIDLSTVATMQPVRAIRYNMFGFFKQCVELYLSLAKVPESSLRRYSTPSIDEHQLKPEDMEKEGNLSGESAKIVMKALYGARLVRYELLWPICSLARQVSRWTVACDKRLHRLMSYIHFTLDHSLESFVGDDPALCHPVLYSDADYAGDTVHSKSTSGLYLAIVGPNTFAPITASCKKQTCVSHSSTESEIVAAEQGIRTEGLQVLTFWEIVVDLLSATHGSTQNSETTVKDPNSIDLNPYSAKFDPVKFFNYNRPKTTVTDLIIAEDNEAVIKIIKKARSMALRHLPRTHRIDLNWLFEVCSNPRVNLRYVGTKQQIADLMTKALNKPETWQHLLDISQIRAGPTGPSKQQTQHKALVSTSDSCADCGFIMCSGCCPCGWT